MLAYHNNAKLKASMSSDMHFTISEGLIIQGMSFRDVVRCVSRVENGSYKTLEEEIGIPSLIAQLAEFIFEGLEYEKAKKFTTDFLEAIPVGADLSMVWPKLIHYVMVDNEVGLINFVKTEYSKFAIERLAHLFMRKIDGEIITENQWISDGKYFLNRTDYYDDKYDSCTATIEYQVRAIYNFERGCFADGAILERATKNAAKAVSAAFSVSIGRKDCYSFCAAYLIKLLSEAQVQS
jgi:hypothetical protein